MPSSPSSPVPASPERAPLPAPTASALLILAAVCLAYAGTWNVPFTLDDYKSIEENPSIRQLSDLRAVLSPPADAGVGGRPLANLTFALSYALGGIRPWAYHLINLIVHAGAALALLGVVRRTALSPRLAPRFAPVATALGTGVALLWALHPLQTQTVTYVSQRTEALMALGYLLTLYAAIRHFEAPTLARTALAVAACVLGALSKESIVTAPALVLLLDRTFFSGSWSAAWRRHRILYCGLAAVWVLLAWLMTDVSRRGIGTGHGVSSYVYALTQLRSVSTYLQLTLWPSPLTFDRDQGVITSLLDAAPYAALVLPLLALALHGLRAGRAWAFSAAAFFLLLAPSSSVLPIVGAPVAENRPYLAVATVVSLVVFGLHAGLGLARCRLACALLALAALAGTIRRNQDYRTEERLWRDTVAKAPANPRAHNNLALALAQLPGRTAETERHYREAIRLNPDFFEAHNGFSVFLYNQPGREAEAMTHAASALRINPEYADGHYNLALLLARLPGRLPEAISHYEEAIRLRPSYADAHNNLALLLAGLPGREAGALRSFSEAIRLRPEKGNYVYNLALLLARLPGREAEALARFEEAHRLEPQNGQMLNDLALLLARLPGRQAEAEARYRQALQLRPDYAEARNNLAVMLSRIPGRQQDALDAFNAALRINPDYAEAHNNLAVLLAGLPGREAEAIAHYETALRLSPGSAALHVNLAIQLSRIPERQAEAASLLRRALVLDPGLGMARELLQGLPPGLR